jgi:DNA-directed RNA polymerase subunit omega
MIIYPPINELLDLVDCRYSLVVMVAKRARQLVAGDAPLIEVEGEQKPVTVAVEEIFQRKVSFERNGRNAL